MKTEGNEMSVIEAGVIATIPGTPAHLLEVAVSRGADVDQLSKLMDLNERWDREQARKSYFAAKAEFQSLAPTIQRTKEAGGSSFKYKYAPLSAISEQIRGPLKQCGLTYRFEIRDEGQIINVTCILSHVDGHSESNTMGAAPDDSGAKNAIQQRGSTVTYLQRYTLIGALGLTSADDDDDGQSNSALNVEMLRRHNEVVRDLFHSVYVIKQAIADQDYSVAAEAWAELTQDEQRAVWVAPTKGGIFTTKEREAMKSDEWNAARQGR